MVPEEACPGKAVGEPPGADGSSSARVALRIHCPGVLGAIAQLVEHLLGRQGVRGSNPLSSTEAGPKGSYSNPAEFDGAHVCSVARVARSAASLETPVARSTIVKAIVIHDSAFATGGMARRTLVSRARPRIP